MADGTLFGNLRQKTVVDLFCGLGGTSLGVEMGLGVSPVAAVNHWAYAIKTHAQNHPMTVHFEEDVFNVEPWQAARGRKVDLLVGSPDCFPAGTAVLTSTGYRPIETLQVGDLVLTHKGRWRRVTTCMQSMKQPHVIRGYGHPGLRVSGEHPFWGTRQKEQPAGDWIPAKDLTKGCYWATPMHADTLPIPSVNGRGLSFDDRLLWLAGRYVADGWSRLSAHRAELVICCGEAKVTEARAMLNRWPRMGDRAVRDEVAWSERKTATEVQFATNHRGLVIWLQEQFGHLAQNKTIPGWMYGLPISQREAFLSGYLSGDGCIRDGLVSCVTVSRALAFGLKTLVATLGMSSTVFRQSKDGKGIIQGRTVNVQPSWHVRYRLDLQNHHCYKVDQHLLCPVKENTKLDTTELMFNLSVEEDESYVVEGIVVHNCTHFSVAKGSAPRDSGRRSLADVFVRWAEEIRPSVIILENVSEFTKWGPLYPEDYHTEKLRGQPIKERAGEDFARWKRAIESHGYVVEHRLLRACDYGAPTSRLRLFIVARCDGRPIVWPKPTHGPGTDLAWHSAAECIDWSIPCRSIFNRKKPLAENTQRRIAQGFMKYVINNPRPFLLNLSHGGRLESIDDPLKTITTTKGGERALILPWLAKHYTGAIGSDVRDPLATITTQDHHSLCAAYLLQMGYGDKAGAPPRLPDLQRPLGTITSQGNKFGLVAAFLCKYYGADGQVQSLDRPIDTITCKHRFGLVTANINGEPWQVVDIGMRMLEPRELARAQGFPDSYVLEGSKADQIAGIGNSVVPQVMAALVRVNVL